MATQTELRRVGVGLLLLVATVISVSLALALHQTWLPSHQKLELRSPDDFLSRFVSPNTARSLAADQVLQGNFLDAVSLTADLTRRLALQFDTVAELQEASEHMEKYRRSLARSAGPERRGLGDLFGLGGSSDSNKTDSSSDSGILSGIASSIGSAFSGIGSSLLQDASGAGLFLGTGLGAGAAQGLNLAPAAMTMQVAAKVAADNGMNATGLNPTIQNAAMGATASLLGSLNLSSVLSDAGGGVDLHSVALGLAMGIGNGTSAGLKLSSQAEALQAPAGNTTGDIAGTFGFGLTKSLVSNVNISKLTSSAGSSFNVSSITGGQPISQIALSLAQGIGSGASSGLKLSQANVAAPQGTSTADIAGAFGFGLTQSVTQNINISSLASSSSAASGLTKSLNIGMIAQGAAMGLIQGAGDAVNSMGGIQALINGTAKISTGSLPGTTMTFNDSVGGAATGFGQGLGGQGTLVGVQLLSQVNVTSLLAGLTGNSTGPSEAVPAVTNGTGSAVVKRDLSHPAEIIRRQAQATADGSASGSFNLSLIINADSISSVGQSAINALTCEGIGGLILVALGLASSGTINTNGASSVNSTFLTEALPKGIIHFTSGGNTFQIDGTTISAKLGDSLLGAADGVIINGSPLIKFAAFLVLHILIALLAFINLVPAVLSMEAARNLLVRLKMSHILPNIPRWVDIIWLYLLSPLAILALLFGSLTGGSAGHFRTAHGILGLITILITLCASATHFFVKQTSPAALQQAIVLPTTPFQLLDPLTIRTAIIQTLFVLVLPTTLTGFADLSSITLCVTRIIPLETGIAFGVGLSLLYAVASVSSGLTIWLSSREVWKMTKGKRGSDEEAWGKKSLKEKIEVVRKESTMGNGSENLGKDDEFMRN